MLNYIMSNYMSLVLKVRPGSTEQKPDSFGLLNGNLAHRPEGASFLIVERMPGYVR